VNVVMQELLRGYICRDLMVSSKFQHEWPFGRAVDGNHKKPAWVKIS
jgi:hypothetical protein